MSKLKPKNLKPGQPGTSVFSAGDPDILNSPYQRRRRKTKSLLPRSLAEYFDQRIHEKADLFEDDQVSSLFDGNSFTPAMEKTRLRNKIFCMNIQLGDSRKLWRDKKELLEKRWEEAIEKQTGTYKSLKEFNTHYKKSLLHRAAFKEQEAAEMTAFQEREREIRAKTKELASLTKVLDNLKARVDKFSIYKEYLERVKEESQGEYAEVKDVIDRYGTLATYRDVLAKRNDNYHAMAAQRQKNLDDDIMTKSNEVLAYRNYLSELLEYDVALREKVQALGESLLRIKTSAAQRTLMIGQIKMAVLNLYQNICKTLHRHANLKLDDTLGHVRDIAISVKEMKSLSADVKKLMKAARMAARAETEAREKILRKEEERRRKIEKLQHLTSMDPRVRFGLPPLPKRNSVNHSKMTSVHEEQIDPNQLAIRLSEMSNKAFLHFQEVTNELKMGTEESFNAAQSMVLDTF